MKNCMKCVGVNPLWFLTVDADGKLLGIQERLVNCEDSPHLDHVIDARVLEIESPDHSPVIQFDVNVANPIILLQTTGGIYIANSRNITAQDEGAKISAFRKVPTPFDTDGVTLHVQRECFFMHTKEGDVYLVRYRDPHNVHHVGNMPRTSQGFFCVTFEAGIGGETYLLFSGDDCVEVTLTKRGGQLDYDSRCLNDPDPDAPYNVEPVDISTSEIELPFAPPEGLSWAAGLDGHFLLLLCDTTLFYRATVSPKRYMQSWFSAFRPSATRSNEERFEEFPLAVVRDEVACITSVFINTCPGGLPGFLAVIGATQQHLVQIVPRTSDAPGVLELGPLPPNTLACAMSPTNLVVLDEEGLITARKVNHLMLLRRAPEEIFGQPIELGRIRMAEPQQELNDEVIEVTCAFKGQPPQ